MLNGFPPKKIDAPDASKTTEHIKSGDAIVVQTGEAAQAVSAQSRAPAPAAAPPSTAPSADPVAAGAPDPVALELARRSSIAAQGNFVMRVVPDDNSCLFRSVNGIMGRQHDSASPLRLAVANAVRADTVTYNEAVLGRSSAEYCSWIMTDNAWGGPIELAILADHLKVELGAFDIRTMRLDRYGQGRAYPQIGFLVYDGLHYNFLALALEGAGGLDITQFDAKDIYAQECARRLAAIQHAGKQYTVTASFKLKCDICGTKVRGEADALKHGKATGHSSFSEASR